MAQTVIGDRLTPEMEHEVDNFFDEFNALCRKHGVSSALNKSGPIEATAKGSQPPPDRRLPL